MNQLQTKCTCGTILAIPTGTTQAQCPNCGTTLRFASVATARGKRPANPAPQSGSISGQSQSRVDFSSRTQTHPWLLIVAGCGAGAIVLGTIIVAVVLIASRGDKESSSEAVNAAASSSGPQNSGGSQSTVASPGHVTGSNEDQVRVAQFPEGPPVPGLIEYLPRSLVNAVPFDVASLYDSIPPTENAMYEHMRLIAMVSNEMRSWISDEEWSQIAKIDRNFLDSLGQQQDWNAAELRQTDQAVAALSVLVAEKQCRYPLEPSYYVMLPHMQGERAYARILDARFRHAMKQGDPGAALPDLLTLLRLGNLKYGPSVIVVELVNVAEQEIGISCAIDACQVDLFSRSDYLEVFEELQTIEKVRASRYLSSMQMEQLTFVSYILDLKHQPGRRVELVRLLGAMMGNPEWTLPPAMVTELTQMTDAEFDTWIQDGEKYFAELNDLMKRGNVRFVEIRQAADRAAVLVEEYYEPNRMWPHALLFPAIDAFAEAEMRGGANSRGCQCLIALRIWKMDHDQPPATIGELFQNVGAEPPIDPFSGLPFKMIQRDGKTVFYSWGRDGVDDKALKEWLPRENYQSNGDLIFSLDNE